MKTPSSNFWKITMEKSIVWSNGKSGAGIWSKNLLKHDVNMSTFLWKDILYLLRQSTYMFCCIFWHFFWWQLKMTPFTCFFTLYIFDYRSQKMLIKNLSDGFKTCQILINFRTHLWMITRMALLDFPPKMIFNLA